jgi:glutamate-1-semialdehyde 2,1-aminomutase
MMGKGQELYHRAKKIIPGGTQLLSKRPERFLPEQWPAYYSKAQGAFIWDLDGNRYLDMTTSGVGSCVLGYADSDVDGAVITAIRSGSMSMLNCSEEVELAELLCELHPWADMVRYARGGGEAMAVAARIARAATGRDLIAFCGYHGWHDWYLAANLAEEKNLDGHLLPGLDPAGVPRGLAGTMLPFTYNKIEELEAIVAEHGSKLAAIVMEPARSQGPQPNFLERVRELASQTGAVLVFDEVTSAWRMNTGGIHLTFGVNPDIAVFAKAMSNGYAMAAIIGNRSVMDTAQSTFISSTTWTERVGPTAALATIKKHRQLEVSGHLIEVGNQVQAGWRELGTRHGLKVHPSGIPPLSHLGFDYENGDAITTLFTQLMLDKGILASAALSPSLAHNDEHVNTYLEAVDEVFAVCAKAVQSDTVEASLNGPIRHADFRRLA